MDQDEAQTDSEACQVACTDFAVSCAEHYKHEEECGDDFHQECPADSSGIGHSVGAEALGAAHCAGCSSNVDDKEQEGAGDDTADELADPVAASVFPAHTAGESYAKGDSRIDVAAADAADGVGHGNYGKTEGDGGADDAGSITTSKEHCSSATKESQDECAQTFSKILFHKLENIGYGFHKYNDFFSDLLLIHHNTETVDNKVAVGSVETAVGDPAAVGPAEYAASADHRVGTVPGSLRVADAGRGVGPIEV